MFAPDGCRTARSHCQLAVLVVLTIAWHNLAAADESAAPPPPAADSSAADSSATATLSQQIDQHLPALAGPIAVAPESAGRLLRRLSLDLRGVVPTHEELEAFVADTSADRWANWVDRFLNDPLCDEHLVTFLDRTLMLRRSHSQVDRASWINFLRDRLAAETPLDILSGELLYTPWWNQNARAAQRFYLDRGGDPHLTTRDLARVFLGRDLQCAQCHDHPLVDDFRQIDYHGLLAFVASSSLAEATYKDSEGKDQKVQLYIEKAAGDAPFESVFEKGTLLRSGTRLVGQPEHFEEYLRPDQRYLDAAPEGALAGVQVPPKQSRREQLAGRLASRDNNAFVANWANRLWALVYGRGLVHPVDMVEPDNPPSNPDLYRLIADGLLQSDMRIKPFLRHLVMAEAYRRGGPQPFDQQAAGAELDLLRQQLESQLATAETEIETLTQAEEAKLQSYEAAREAWLKVQSERTTARAELDSAETALMDAKKKQDEANAALAAAEKKLSDSQTRSTLLAESASKLEQALALAGGEDAELSQAIAVAKQRSEAAAGENPALQQAITDTQAAATAAATATEQAVATVNAVVEKLKPIQSALLAADRTTVAARQVWSDARSAVVNAQRKLDQTEHLLQWVQGVAKREQLAQSTRATEEQIAAAKTAAATMEVAVKAAQTELATADLGLQTADQAVAKAMQDFQQQQQTISTLEQTLTSIDTAAKLVQQAEPLIAAQASLRGDIDGKRTQLGAFQSALDVAKANQAGKSELRGKQQAELDGLMAKQKQQTTQLTSLQNQLAEWKTQTEAAQVELGTQTDAVWKDNEAQLAVTGLYPLTAEQMCWSTLRVTGVLDAYVRGELAELEKQSPLPAEADEATKNQRQRQAVRQAIEKLRGIADQYVALYASGPDKTQDDFFASADQALYVANGGSVFSWAGPGNNNPTQLATTLTDPAEVAKVLYWSYLCRLPNAEETQFVTEQLAAAGDQRNTIIQEMAWSLLASAEFRFVR